MVSKTICVLILWTRVASAFEGLIKLREYQASLYYTCAWSQWTTRVCLGQWVITSVKFLTTWLPGKFSPHTIIEKTMISDCYKTFEELWLYQLSSPHWNVRLVCGINMVVLTLPMLKLRSSKAQGTIQTLSCWYSLDTRVSVIFPVFLHHFVLVKLATSSI